MAALGIVLFSCLCSLTLVFAESSLPEEDLLNHLRSKSAHPLARPVKNPNDYVEVKFGLSMQSLHLLEETNPVLQSNVWFNYEWKDHFLSWNEANFSGIQSVRVPIGSLWHPDIDVYNSAKETSQHDTLVVLYSDGTVNWVPRAIITSGCTMDYEYFPFDTQVCVIKVGSWTLDGSKLNLTLRDDTADTSNYTPNNLWNLIDSPAKRHVKQYECCPEPYIDVTFTFKLLRRTTYLTYVYVAPVVLLSLLGTVIFILPPGNPQKMTLGGALVICYSIFYLVTDRRLPAIETTIPLIDKYFMAMFVMLAISVTMAAISTNLAKRSTSLKHPPELLRKVVLGILGRLLCVSYTEGNYTNFPLADEELAEVKAGGSSSGPGEQQAGRPGHIREWVLIATVFDRLFLVLYLVFTILVTLIILLNHPHALG